MLSNERSADAGVSSRYLNVGGSPSPGSVGESTCSGRLLDRATDGVEGIVQLREVSRAVFLGVGTGSTAEFAGLAEHVEEGAGGQGFADGILAERVPLRPEDARTSLQASFGKGGYRT